MSFEEFLNFYSKIISESIPGPFLVVDNPDQDLSRYIKYTEFLL